uniref:Uncharacterized protein n=1 Tax=Vespula pensylvanica TaxID=30213 RepID=A0A834U9J3_VESPE|nr:hypothetical protein H0235_008919 [Vespula pensylvanica]
MDISVVVMMVVDGGIGDGISSSSSSNNSTSSTKSVALTPVAVVDTLIASTKQGTILGGPMRRPPQPSENLFGLRIFYVSEENPRKHPPNYASKHVNIDSTVTSGFSAYREVGQFLRQEKRNGLKS